MKTQAFLTLFTLLFLNSFTGAANEFIPLENIRQPSDDLIFEGNKLSSEQAWALSKDEKNPLDLSLLDPEESEVWKNELLNDDEISADELPVSEDETFNFQSTILSNAGLMRFNVIPDGEGLQRVFTVHMEKTLHTYLLRRNLLRKLGYVIPGMKYLKKINIQFNNIEERDHFFSRQVPEATYGASSRWTKKEVKDLGDELNITVFDVYLTMPLDKDHYNTASALPPKRMTKRALRSLIIPYALLNIGESINKLPWHVGREDNKGIILPQFTNANMMPTSDDALWGLRRLAKLTRKDFKEVVFNAGYPDIVSKLLLEKIIARRNTLIKVFGLKISKIDFDVDVNEGHLLKKGVLTQEDWEGYASRFAHGEADSPFQDFEYYIFSKLQTSLLENLLSIANKELSFYDPNDERIQFHQDQFETGLNHFISTGEFLDFGVGTWVSPTLDGNLILNRDIVIGNHLGTDNLVQQADTLGFSVELGAHVGFENVSDYRGVFVKAGVSYLRTYSHLKPVKTLKASFKEPYKNIIVPLMKVNLRKQLDQLANMGSSEFNGEGEEEAIALKRKMMDDLFIEINRNLGVGESLIITDKITPKLFASGTLNMIEKNVSLAVGSEYGIIKRIHIFRKDDKTIQVYKDKGTGLTFSGSITIDHYIPIIRFQSSVHTGKYTVRFHQVNIDTDLEANPGLYKNSAALYHLLETGDDELLETIAKPTIIEGKFKDKSKKFSFLFWRAKFLKGKSDVTVTTPNGHRSEYISLSDHKQTGNNYQSFTYDILNYYLGKFVEDYDLRVSTARFINPGHSPFGKSETLSAHFEGLKRSGEGIQRPFIRLVDRKEGWSIQKYKLKKLIVGINEKYRKTIFDDDVIEDTEGLKIYDVSVSMNLYGPAIQKLVSLKRSNLKKLKKRYIRERKEDYGCANDPHRNNPGGPRSFIDCGHIDQVLSQNKKCQKFSSRKVVNKKHAQCLLKLVKRLSNQLEVDDLIKILGEDNIFIQGAINGFRSESEILNEPILGHTIGKVRSRFWNGPLTFLKEKLDIQNGEFDGSWIRETL
jgi:hypothetical protein